MPVRSTAVLGVQSGNHPNPSVSFDAGDTDSIAEALKLVE